MSCNFSVLNLQVLQRLHVAIFSRCCWSRLPQKCISFIKNLQTIGVSILFKFFSPQTATTKPHFSFILIIFFLCVLSSFFSTDLAISRHFFSHLPFSLNFYFPLSKSLLMVHWRWQSSFLQHLFFFFLFFFFANTEKCTTILCVWTPHLMNVELKNIKNIFNPPQHWFYFFLLL